MTILNLNRKYTFKRTLKHSLAFNKVARQLGVWNVKHLFHDIDKPILNLFRNNQFVREYHRQNSNHHLEYKDKSKINIVDLIVDWECSRITKSDKPLNARGKYFRDVLNDTRVSQNLKIQIANKLKELKL